MCNDFFCKTVTLIRLRLVDSEGQIFVKESFESESTLSVSDQDALRNLKECLDTVKKREMSLGDKIQKSKYLVTK